MPVTLHNKAMVWPHQEVLHSQAGSNNLAPDVLYDRLDQRRFDVMTRVPG